MPHVDVFETTFQKSEEWIHDIQRALGWDDPHRAYLALRAVLHTVRDRLPLAEANHLGAQLPMLLRGLYYEGWTPRDKPVKLSKNEFLLTVASYFQNDRQINAAALTRTVLDVIASRIDPMEFLKLPKLFPQDFAELWPLTAVR